MRRNLTITFTTWAVFALLVLAPAASASENDGRGLYGATDDKVVTTAGLILIVFFPTFVFTMSMIQKALDKRKEARMAGERAVHNDARWRGGW